MQITTFLTLSILIVTVCVNVLLSFFVYKNNPKSYTNKIFASLGIIVSIWLLIMYVSLRPAMASLSLFWIRSSIVLAAPMSLLFYLLAYNLPSEKLQIKKAPLIILGVITTVIMLINMSSYAFARVDIIHGIPNPIPGFGLIPFGLFVIVSTVGTIYTLYKRLRRSNGIVKQQLRIILTGILLMHGLMITTIFLPVTIFHNNTFVSFFPLYAFIFLLTTTYAIIRHRFLDIRLIVARSVAYTLLIILLGLFYSILLFIGGIYISGKAVTTFDIFSSTLLALIIAFSLQPLRRVLEKITNKIFYKQIYNSHDLLWSLSLIMASKLVLSDLVESILKALFAQMKISHGFLVLLQKGSIIWLKAEGIEKAPEFNEAKVGKLLEEVMKKEAERLLVFEELPDSEVKNIMREYNISIVLPLVVDNVGIGVLLFGEKSSGDIYSIEDIDVFKILSPEIAIAVRNSLSYEEIKRFNITLEEEVKRATSELQLANEKLKMLDKLKDEFVSLASHELRTPMTAIKSYLWMALAGKGGDLSEKQKYYLNRSYQSTERLINLVNDMLNVSRIESGRITLVFAAVPMMTLTQEVFEELHPRAQELGVNLVMSESKGLPDVVADSDKIKQVLINLLGNALKFTPKDGTITVSFAQKDGMITTQVSDTGEGIAKEDQPKLFQKFGMVGNNYLTRQNTQGTGLGLFISKKIIEMHGGKIWVESEGIGKGTTFTFSLQPFSKEVQEKMQKLQEKQEAPAVKS